MSGRARVAVLLLVGLGASSCGEDPVAPQDRLAVIAESSRYRYHAAPDDSVDVEWQEAYVEWVTEALAVPTSPRLDYFKYRDRAHLERVTGRSTNGFAEPGTTRFHTIWPRDSHEGVHALFILHVGHPPALFNEGVAVAHQMDPVAGDLVARWNSDPVHDIARFRRDRGEVPDLDVLLESPDFFGHPQGLTYPLAGSFVRWLLDTHGLDRLEAYAAEARFGDDAYRTRQLIVSAYGRPIDVLWSDWLAWLG